MTAPIPCVTNRPTSRATSRRPRGVRLVAAIGLVATVLASIAVTSVTGRAAAADPLGDAKAQAVSLQARVASLRVRAEQASEQYDAATAQLIGVIAEGRAAQKKVAAANAAVAADQATVARDARTLYMSGGAFSKYAAVLSGGDPTHLLIALNDMQTISTANRRLLTTTQADRQAARAAQAEAAAAIDQQATLTKQAEAAEAQVRGLLGEQQQALATANSRVLAIEAQIQAALDAQSAARAAQSLIAARQAALTAGFTDAPVSAAARIAIVAASTQLGKQYVYGGSGPDVWDCSGLTQWAYRQAGVGLPRTAAEQYLAVATKVPLGELEPGDLLFWATDLSNPATIHHVAIYLGNDQMLAAPHTGTVVQVQPVYLDGYFGAVRP